MNASKVFSAMAVIIGLVAVNCIAAPPQTPGPQLFEWTNRLELNSEQQKLLHIRLKLEDTDLAPEKRQRLEADAKQLSEELGVATVRRARPQELILTMDKQAGSIFNPSSDNVAFTVSVRGDEEQLGTRKGSVGRLTYLPPKASLRVQNIYWTTPGMTKKH